MFKRSSSNPPDGTDGPDGEIAADPNRRWKRIAAERVCGTGATSMNGGISLVNVRVASFQS